MSNGLANALIVAALVLAAWSLIVVVLDRTPSDVLLIALALLETGLLVQAVVAAARLVGGDGPDSAVVFTGYLIASLLILPAGTFWSLAERSRWGTGVLTVACLVVPVVIVRMNQTWQPTGG